jgi:glycerophosphoryl diester phosphodiesterase
VNHDGKIDDADGTATLPTNLIADAHRTGLLVHPYTFRNELRRLATEYKGDGFNEYIAYYRLGVNGVSSDFTDMALSARFAWLQDRRRYD